MPALRPTLAALVAVLCLSLAHASVVRAVPGGHAPGEFPRHYQAIHVPLPVESAGPTTPTGAVRALAEGYSSMSLPTLEGLLADDFQFHTTDANIARLINVDRDTELLAARTIFHGSVQDGKVVVPPADSISFVVTGLTENADPEHPDSTAHYRTVTVAHFQGNIYLPDSLVYNAGTQGAQVFYVVRGDAAVLAAAGTPDSTRWYIRRWFEDLDALVTSLSAIEGDCDQAAPPTPAATLAFGIRPLGNPACPALEIACDLPRGGPARVEVLDVMGRRMNELAVQVAGPGTIRLQAGAGVHLAPGAYWVRLSQGDQYRTRMVVVAR
jgi:hypothetical protein